MNEINFHYKGKFLLDFVFIFVFVLFIHFVKDFDEKRSIQFVHNYIA